MSKSFKISKTVWFGALWIVVGAAGLFGFADFLPGENVVQIGEIVNGVLIIILRFLTNQGVHIKQ